MFIFLHFFLWNLNHVFKSSSKIDKNTSLGQEIGNQMINHSVVNKPPYFVTSLCAIDVCFYKLTASLVQCRYTGEFYYLKWEKLHKSFQSFCSGEYALETWHPARGCSRDKHLLSLGGVKGRYQGRAVQVNAFLWVAFRGVLYNTGMPLCSSAIL